jgi:hypothetical protein
MWKFVVDQNKILCGHGVALSFTLKTRAKKKKKKSTKSGPWHLSFFNSTFPPPLQPWVQSLHHLVLQGLALLTNPFNGGTTWSVA